VDDSDARLCSPLGDSLAVLAVSGPSPAAVWAAAAHVCSYLLAGTDAANGGADAPTEEALMVGTRKPRALYKPTQFTLRFHT
jgi:hypothetical protein